MANLSIVIPALDEESGIAAVLEQIRALEIPGEVIVVDDGSSDRTGEIARESGALVVRHVSSMGYGRSLKDGIRAASSEWIAITDADGTYPVDEIPKLVEGMNAGFDMVVGARQGKYYRGSFLKMPARGILKLLVQFTSGSRIPDINSGLRIFRKADLEEHWQDLCDTFSFTTTLTLSYLLTKKTIRYVPIMYHERLGRSKVRMIRDSLRTTQYIIQFICRYNPMKLFVLLTVFALLIGLACGYTVGWANAALFSGLTATLIFALGLAVESLRVPR